MRNNVYSDNFDTRICFYLFWKKMKIFKISSIIYMTQLWGDYPQPNFHTLSHSESYKDWSRNVEILQLKIFIIFEPICEIFTLSFEIMVILDWTSPLRIVMMVYVLSYWISCIWYIIAQMITDLFYFVTLKLLLNFRLFMSHFIIQKWLWTPSHMPEYILLHFSEDIFSPPNVTPT